jgi:hypothetical protein
MLKNSRFAELYIVLGIVAGVYIARNYDVNVSASLTRKAKTNG